MTDALAIAGFLRKMHLFRGLNEEQLMAVVAELKERSFPEPDTVFNQGEVADSLWIVYQGKVDIARKEKEKETKVASLVSGDYFGEQGLLLNQRRNATVRAEKGTVLLILYREPFKKIFRQIPGLKENFDVMISSRKLAAQLRFKWVGEGEIIYFLARKHSLLLIRSLLIPILLLAPIFFLLYVAVYAQSFALGALGGFLLVLNLAWLLWRFLDWGNDFYIVTNRRVIWLEKVIGLYDSRTEANMGTILSVSTETDMYGRWFDYGTVVVRTFTGQIRLIFVSHPKQAAAMIDEYWSRSKDVVRKSDEEVLRKALMSKLKPPPPALPPPPPPPPPKKKPRPSLRAQLRNAFKVRIEESGVVTYRKHVYILLRDTVWYNVIFAVLVMSPFVWGFNFGAPPTSFWTILAFLLVFDLGFWLYEYVDWANDLYQVTNDQIIDINRKPFGTEDRKAAPLENILSTEYKRKGILGMLLNYGTVFIMVGGTQFNFDDVFDPPSVQQDIVFRQQARLQKKREVDGTADRERMATWLALYRKAAAELDQEEREKQQKQPGA